MSILIRGMDMPTRCLDCPMNCRMPDSTFVYPAYSTNDNCPSPGFSIPILCRLDFKPRDPLQRNNCPLIEVPPHGALVDLSELLRTEQTLDEYGDWVVKADAIANAPTIIPAEEGGTRIDDAPTVIESGGET